MSHGHSSVMAKPFSPLLFAPPLWLDSADSSTITLASGLVSQWNNKGTLGGNFAQSTATAQPNGDGTYTQNGLRAIRFDGTNDTLVSSLAASSWKFLHDGTITYMLAVVATENAAVTGEILTARSSNATQGTEFRRNATSTQLQLLVANDAGTNVSNVLLSSNTTNMQIVTFFSDPSNATLGSRGSIVINNGAPTANNTSSATVSSSNPLATAFLGSRNGNAGTWWIGRMCEIIIISGANATGTNASTLRTYLNTKWAVY